MNALLRWRLRCAYFKPDGNYLREKLDFLRDGIMVVFYTGLPHMHAYWTRYKAVAVLHLLQAGINFSHMQHHMVVFVQGY